MNAIYLRKSRNDEGTLNETLAKHEKILVDLANKQKLRIEKIYKEVVSGETIASRPVMQELLSEVEKGTYTGVLVVEIERLARGDTLDQGIVAQAFKYSNTKIITPLKTYDPGNEFDEEFFEFGLFMSRREYKTINRRLQQGRLASVKEGRYVGSIAPYGYNRIKAENGYTLEPNKDEAPIVQMIFDLYVNERIGVSKIVRKLNETGIKARKGNWSPATIQGMLRNIIYIGKIRWNFRKTIKKVVDGKVENSRPRNTDYEVVEGLHDPLIDENVFNLAQEYINQNKHTPCPKDKPIQNPLAGLMKCGLCGRNMVRRPYNNRKQEDTLMCPYTDCKNVSSPLSLVEKLIIKSIETYRYENKQKENVINTELLEKHKENICKELETLKKQKDNLHNLLEQGIYDTNTFLDRSKIINTKITDLEQNLKNIDAEMKSHVNKEVILPKILELIKRYDQLDIKAKNDMLKSVLTRVVYIKKEKALKKDAPHNIDLRLFYII